MIKILIQLFILKFKFKYSKNIINNFSTLYNFKKLKTIQRYESMIHIVRSLITKDIVFELNDKLTRHTISCRYMTKSFIYCVQNDNTLINENKYNYKNFKNSKYKKKKK